jgi:putative membrane protein
MNRFILRWAINAVALYAAIYFVPGVTAQNANFVSIILLALIFGLINALLRPILTLLTCPLIVLTLGIFTLIINTLLFYLVGLVGTYLGIGFTVDGFWPAFLGGVVVSVVSIVLSLLLKEELRRR